MRNNDVLEEVDLELDILRSSDGSVWVRDREVFDCVRTTWVMPDNIVKQAEATCERVRGLIKRGAEPFEAVGRAWLSQFLDEIDTPSP